MILVRWLLPTLISLALPAAAEAAAAAKSTADIEEAVKSGVSAALASTYSGVLNAATAGMTCTGNATLGADGNTPDTDGLIAAVTQAATMSQGAEIMLPTGLCVLNKEIDIPVSASMRFTGAGIGLTTLQFWTPAGVSTPVGNGLVFSITNNANLTIDDFTIERRLGSNLGTTFIGTAITVAASTTTPQAGNVVAENLDIYPPGPTPRATVGTRVCWRPTSQGR